MLRYYFEILDNNDERVAATLDLEEKLTDDEFVQSVVEFAEEENICPSWALQNCKFKIEEIN